MATVHVTVNMFREAASNGDFINLKEYTSTVTSYIGKCIDDVTTSKTITIRSNQKPWMTAKVRALLKTRASAFRAGDKTALKTARAKLSRAIREAKRAHTKRIHGHFQDSGDTRRMWQGIQAITNYKTTSPACDRDASLPDALNDFYARFEVQNNVVARKTIPPPSDQVLCLTTAEARKILCSVNPRKSAGPDNISGRVLRECAEQLADVFTDIFNISLSSATVPSCLKMTTIIPVPKKSSVSCLNDYRPVALTPIMMKCFERLGCVLSPLLFTLLTHDCAPRHRSNHVIKFADDSTVVGLISKNDESAYREEVQRLTAWCGANNLSLNVDKTKEMVVDFRRARSDHSPLIIDGYSVEIVKSTKFLGVHLADNLTWSLNTSSITKKQRLYFLRRLRKAHLPPPILTMFYRGTIESIVSSCITTWFGNCTVSDRKTLQRIAYQANLLQELAKGFSSGANDIKDLHRAANLTILHSRASSTRRLYAARWHLFTTWCEHDQLDPVNCPVGSVLEFLQEQFSTGVALSILKVDVSAIAAYCTPPAGQSLGKHPCVGFGHCVGGSI
ncbi:gastrula zinc finger protein XlCGF28.1-like [Silurus meridionalis]|nr:gastrula zinc finger protein XlCGF28.1-like [Silurus meridionalis]